ncbi:DigA protein [Panaeolus papilionaceus]|nr:DigA protein [Panaeolus papilionaceus]
MFDDYVEHAAHDATQSVQHPASTANLNYEGFEPSPFEENDSRAEMERVEDMSNNTNVPVAPVFDLGRVQYAFPAPLVSFVVCSDMLAMAFTSNLIVLIELSRADQVIRIPIPSKPNEMSIYKLFMDPSGRHIIVTSTQGDNWYLYRTWKKPRQLKSFKMVIESVAWNKAALLSSVHSTSTREILLGTRNGMIYEAVLDAEEDFFKSQERYLQPVYSLPERHPISGVRFDHYPPIDPRKSLVIVTTPSRIYQFSGPVDRKLDDRGRVFTPLFASYRDSVPKISELPGNLDHSELQFYTPNPDQAVSLPKRLAWMTGPGIYHGGLNIESDSEDHIDGAGLLPYPPTPNSDMPEVPISMSLTEFHFILLYKDRIVGICNLNDKAVYEELLPIKPGEKVLGMGADPVRRTFWVYTDQSLFELVVGNEDRDVWKIYLDKGQFDVSLRYSKTARQRDQILYAQANSLFKNAQYYNASQCYAQCSATFEEVSLKFLDVGERDALRAYLISRLERTKKTDVTQRMILATWLVEFYLSKCNELDDIVASESVSHDVENLQTERAIIEEDLRHFFETYKTNLDKDTVYDLIQGHGRTDMYLFYAKIVGDCDRVIEHWVMEEQWLKAIEILSGQTNLELYYRFGSVLMRHAPQETVDSWIRQTSLDPLRLVPALLQLQRTSRDPLSPNHAIRYLNHVIFQQKSISSTIHNLIITFHVSPHSPPSYSPSAVDDGPLLRFLSEAPGDPLTGKPYYDLDYALRICKQAGRTQPCVHIYSKMGLWENSVDLALEKGDLELAKVNADMPEDDAPLRKKLWLKIARYVVQDKKDIKSAMRFLENADLLKIEDILPFFPDFVVIDDFKEEIAHALEGYSGQIDSLKAEMDEATSAAESIKKDIAALKNRFITIDANEKCSQCTTLLFTRQFYVFPCHHTFHADCLIGLAKDFLPPHTLRRMVTLQTELMKDARSNATKPVVTVSAPPGGRNPTTQKTLLSANFGPIVNPLQNGAKAANLLGRSVISAGDRLRDLIIPDALASLVSSPNWLPGMGSATRTSDDQSGASKRTESLRAELDDMLSSSCPLCESVVAGLDKPFISEGEADSSWTL